MKWRNIFASQTASNDVLPTKGNGFSFEKKLFLRFFLAPLPEEESRGGLQVAIPSHTLFRSPRFDKFCEIERDYLDYFQPDGINYMERFIFSFFFLFYSLLLLITIVVGKEWFMI